MVDIQRPSPIDVTRDNPRDVVYIKGDNFTDGSIRVRFGPDDIAVIETRMDGVWNLGELELSRGSLHLGRGVRLSAVGHHLVVDSPVETQSHLITSASFDDSGSEQPHAVLLDPRVTRIVVQADNSREETLAIHTPLAFVQIGSLIHQVYFQTGVTAASGPVLVEFSTGVPPNDILFFRENFPASAFPASTEIILDLFPGVIFFTGEQVNLRFESDNAFSLLYEALPGPNLWTALDLQVDREETLFSFPSGFDQLMVDRNTGEVMVDRSGNVMALRG